MVIGDETPHGNIRQGRRAHVNGCTVNEQGTVAKYQLVYIDEMKTIERDIVLQKNVA